MKHTILPILFLFLIGCKENINTTEEGHKKNTEIQKRLKKSDIPIEVIESGVSYISSPIRVNNSILLRYELNILNNYRIPFTLKKVEIYNFKENEIPIANFDSVYINEHFERPGIIDSDDLKLLSGNQFGILNLNILFKEGEIIPEKIFHKLYFERQKKNGETVTYPMEVAVINIPNTTTLTLGLPFKKKGKWLYEAESHQDSRFLTEGRPTYPQRFALDWMLIDENGSFAKNDTKKNENWNGYGVELISVANGIVIEIKDGIIENEPLAEDMAVRITRETIGGNYVIIDIGNDIYAFYGHLIPNSIKVKVGDKVKIGQIIGLLGNSGSSDLPHLHFHLESKSNAFLGGEGMPYHIKEFTQLKYYSEEEVSELFKNNYVPLDSLNFVKKDNEFPNGFGLVEIE